MAATLETEWSTLSTGETDFMTQLLNTHSCHSDDLQFGTGSGLEHGSSFWHGDYEPTVGHEHLLNHTNSSLYNYDCCHLNDSRDVLATNDDSMTMDLYVGTEKMMGGSVHEMKDYYEMENEDCLIDACNENFHESSFPLQFNKASVSTNKKRCRASNVQKNERNVKSRKCSKQVSANKEEENNGGGRNLQCTSSSSSGEISNFSQESKGKTRASKGSATDPQSLYVRKRRERINERLKILQNLVPNGTKVDISTMLDEAVQYVNFLKLQIKLLSSNDLWMYAPLAHNGMDIDLKTKMLNALRR